MTKQRHSETSSKRSAGRLLGIRQRERHLQRPVRVGIELYRIDAFYSKEKKHDALGKSIQVRIALQMTKELEEYTNLRKEHADAFRDAVIQISL